MLEVEASVEIDRPAADVFAYLADKVVEFVEGERIRIKTTGGTMPIDVTRTVETSSDGTAIVGAIVRGDSSGLFRIAAPLMKMMVGSSVRKDYAKLKSLLEAADRADG